MKSTETEIRQVSPVLRSRSRLTAVLIAACLTLAAAGNALAVVPNITSPGAASGTVGVPFSYQIVATQSPTSYGTTLPTIPGVTFTAATGCSLAHRLQPIDSGNITATNASGTGTKPLTVTIVSGA